MNTVGSDLYRWTCPALLSVSAEQRTIQFFSKPTVCDAARTTEVLIENGNLPWLQKTIWRSAARLGDAEATKGKPKSLPRRPATFSADPASIILTVACRQCPAPVIAESLAM